MAKSMLFVAMADCLQQPDRTRYMYLLASIPHLTTLIAPFSAYKSMNIDIWIPFAIAIGCLIMTFFVLLVMPEPLALQHEQATADLPGSTSPLLGGDRETTPQGEPHLDSADHDQESNDNSYRQWSGFYRDILPLIQIPGILVCLGLFFIRPIALISRTFVYQHASESFDWPMSRTTWLRFSQAVSSAIVTLFTLPILSALLHRGGYQAKNFDINVIRVSLFVAAVGFATTWQARVDWMLVLGLFISGLAEGFEPSLKGLATSLVESYHNARLLTLAAALEVIARLIGGPVMAKLFSIGRDESHGSEGLCFLASAILFLLLAGAAVIARIQQ